MRALRKEIQRSSLRKQRQSWQFLQKHIASNKVSPRPYLYCMVTGNKQSSSFVDAMTQHLSAPPAETMAEFGFLRQHRPYQPA